MTDDTTYVLDVVPSNAGYTGLQRAGSHPHIYRVHDVDYATRHGRVIYDRKLEQHRHQYLADAKISAACADYRKADGERLAKHVTSPPPSGKLCVVEISGNEPAASVLRVFSIRHRSNTWQLEWYPLSEVMLGTHSSDDADYSDYPITEEGLCRECRAVMTNGGTGQAEKLTAEDLDEIRKDLEVTSGGSGSVVSLDVSKLRPLTTAQRSVMKQIVNSDIDEVRSQLTIQLREHKLARRRQIDSEFSSVESWHATFAPRVQQVYADVERQLKALEKDAQDAGFAFKATLPHMPTGIPTRPAYTEAIKKMEREADELFKITAEVLESERRRLQRIILVSAIDGTAAGDVLKTVPSAENLMQTAMDRLKQKGDESVA